MLSAYVLLLLVAATAAQSENHPWEIGNDYSYLIRSRTMTGLDKLKNQYAGVIMKGLLTVQPKSDDTVLAKITMPKYAQVHMDMPGGWDSRISDENLELKDWPMSSKPFEIKMKHGVVSSLIVERSTPTWEVNLLKSIVSQLQIDTQGENARRERSTQVPSDDQPYAMFRTMEDSVGGRCEVLYDIEPLPEFIFEKHPHLVPKPEMGEGRHLEITKTKNYTRCDHRVGYHFGITGTTGWEPGANDNSKMMEKSSTSRIVISGDLKNYIIQSSVTTNLMFVSPRLYDQVGLVASKMNLTLADVKKTEMPMEPPAEPDSIGSLVYSYGNPLTDGTERYPGKEWPHRNSEERRNDDDRSDSMDSDEWDVVSEERDTRLPKPSMNEAPDNPFMSRMGKTDKPEEKEKRHKMARELVEEIAKDMRNPDTMPESNTLEKFTILTGMVRTMSRMDMEQMESDMKLLPNQDKMVTVENVPDSERKNMWWVWRDTVTQAGTGPALMTILNWIQTDRISGMEAAFVVGRLPTTTRAPTDEYVETLWKMARSDKAKRDRLLETSSILAFTDVLRMAHVNRKVRHNRYPVHSFKHLWAKDDKAMFDKYLPEMAEEMKKAIENDDSPRAQTYILAIGNVGHPAILGIFEPYLEGKRPTTDFQRTMMILSLNKLTELQPSLARGILYKIYLNTMEVHSLRCAAVFMLMKTNPTLLMLQRMAAFTRHDVNRHVNSVVRSSILSASKLTRPRWQQLARNARIASDLLDDKDFSPQYSTSLVTDGQDKDDLAYTLIMNYIGGDDSSFPRALYMGMLTSFGGFKGPQIGVGFMLSSARKIMEMAWDMDPTGNLDLSITEKIAEYLKIKPEEAEKIEGNLFTTRMFLPFDNKLFENLPPAMMSVMKLLKTPGPMGFAKLLTEEVTVSFPMETGLPFVYSLKVPKIMKVIAEILPTEPNVPSIKANLRFLAAKNLLGRVGFIVPFERHMYFSGVDMKTQIHVPRKIELKVDPVTKTVTKTTWKMDGNTGKTTLFHQSVVPFTTVQDVRELRPLGENTKRMILKDEIVRYKQVSNGILVESELNRGGNDKTKKTNMDNILRYIIFPWSDGHNTEYSKFEIKSDWKTDEITKMTLSVDKKSFDNQEGVVNDKQPDANDARPSDIEPVSQPRKKEMLERVAEGLHQPVAKVVEMSVTIPSAGNAIVMMTVAWANSKVDDRSRALVYTLVNVPSEATYEMCTSMRVKRPRLPLLNVNTAVLDKPQPKEQTLDMQMKFGENCRSSESKTVEIEAEAIRSKRMIEDLSRITLLAKECIAEQKEGNDGLRGCQHYGTMVLTPDEYRMVIKLDKRHEVDHVAARALLELVKEIHENTHVVPITNKGDKDDENKIFIKSSLSDDFKKAYINIRCEEEMVIASDINLNELGIRPERIMSMSDDVDLGKPAELHEHQSCVIDRNHATTFDDRTYPVKLGECFHVLMTTYQKPDPEDLSNKRRIPRHLRSTVMARDDGNGRRSLKVYLTDLEIEMQPGSNKPEVTVNGNKIEFSKNKSHKEKKNAALPNEKTILEIWEPLPGTVKLYAKENGVTILFDGDSVQIRVSDDYRNSVRGLCGNFDSQPQNDFVTPKNCVLRKTEEFTATYALRNEKCQGPALENAEKAEKSECMEIKGRASNVISQREKSDWQGKPSNEDWGHHTGERGDTSCMEHRTKVVEKDDKVCFSMRPVPMCKPKCTEIETKEKTYPMHCMANGPAAQEMKQRVEQGAHPDLSQKPALEKETLTVALKCAAKAA